MVETLVSGDASMADVMEVPHLIDGEWVTGAQQDESRDPYRDTVVARVARGTSEDVERAVGAAQRAQRELAAMPGWQRGDLLRRVGELIAEHAEEIGRLMARETGKSVKDGTGEVRRSQATMTLSAEEAIRIEGYHVPLDGSDMGAGKIAMMLRFPVGVVGAITPFNAPFNLACHKVGPAIAAGNGIVLKAPPQAAAVVHKLAELCVKAGFPPGVLNVLHGGADVGKALVNDPRVDFITFTGSSHAGESISSAAGLRRVALELGGNGQTIVHNDADLEKAAEMCARNAMRLAGQSCISVQTALVHRDVHDRFLTRVVEHVQALRLGDPMDSDTDVGTLIDEEAAERVESWVEEAQAAGATIVTGGGRRGAQHQLTVLSGVERGMKVFQEEVFGPVLSVLPYDDFDEAVDLVNSSPYGLQCGLFTESNERTLCAFRRIRTGGLIVNGTCTWRTDQLAYGGVKASGIGREGPRYAIRDMTEERMLLFNM